MPRRSHGPLHSQVQIKRARATTTTTSTTFIMMAKRHTNLAFVGHNVKSFLNITQPTRDRFIPNHFPLPATTIIARSYSELAGDYRALVWHLYVESVYEEQGLGRERKGRKRRRGMGKRAFVCVCVCGWWLAVGFFLLLSLSHYIPIPTQPLPRLAS